MMLSGALIFSYPFISNYLANKNASTAVQNYNEAVDEMDQEEIDAMKTAAEAYNAQLQGITEANESGEGEETSGYVKLISLGDAIGYITIPKIDLNLPIYEGTEDDVLEQGIGHLTQTSYPVGGESTHCALSGHRGLASAELFTNLDKVEVGDCFYLHVLDEVLAYEVDKVSVVEPNDIDEIAVIEGEDLCTLITCTPLGINSHRLLVRGHRVEYTEEDETQEESALYATVHTGTVMERLVRIWPWLALAAILIIGAEAFLLLVFLKRARERKEDD